MSRRRSSSDTRAHGATAANSQMVLVMLAVFSVPMTGDTTISAASTNRIDTDAIHPFDAQRTNHTSNAAVTVAASARYMVRCR